MASHLHNINYVTGGYMYSYKPENPTTHVATL